MVVLRARRAAAPAAHAADTAKKRLKQTIRPRDSLAPRSKKAESDEENPLTRTIITPDRKFNQWSQHDARSPFPKHQHPSRLDCETTHKVLEREHGDTVKTELAEVDIAVVWPHVLQGVVIALLSQATGWSNAKRALASMANVYGDSFAYDNIVEGGVDKLCDAIRCGGMQNRKSKMVMRVLEQVHERHGKWDLDHLFDKPDSEVMEELLSYNGMGPKSAYCVLSIVLKRQRFAVDTHIYRIAGLWGWCPPNEARELVQAHLDDRIPNHIKYDLHYLLIVHGRECAHCKGGSKLRGLCDIRKEILTLANAKRLD